MPHTEPYDEDTHAMTIALLCTAALLGTLLARRLQRARRLARSSAPIQCVRRGGIDVYI